jgi:hypothetical protein
MPAKILVGSEDSHAFIDNIFIAQALGTITRAIVINTVSDLHLSFSSGLTLTTFTSSATAIADDWIQWRLFCPDDTVWAVDGAGEIKRRNVHDQRG